MTWGTNYIEIEPPKNPKKITGTRLGAVLGASPWSTPFEAWCAITRTYEEPFVDTIYTAAGKAIEPKQIQYMADAYFMSVLTPTEAFGEDYFTKTRGDFFPQHKIFGGMWDALALDEFGNVESVLEFKTTKRAEDWQNDVPEYYALQAALYAWLVGVDSVIMVASFLEEKDYKNPEAFEPSTENTITYSFNVSERYPDFAGMIKQAEEWWEAYVEGGISPNFDEKKDAEILEELRKNTLSPDTDIAELMSEAETLKTELDAVAKETAAKEKRLKKVNDLLKEYAMGQFREGDTKVELNGQNYSWTLSKTEKPKVTINEEALVADGLYDKYAVKTIDTSYRFTVSKLKGEKNNG